MFRDFILFFAFISFYVLFVKYNLYRTGIETSKFIKDTIKMSRDEHGIPSIEAQNVHDAYFAIGFSQAEDRLWQMYLNYKIAMGEASEVK